MYICICARKCRVYEYVNDLQVSPSIPLLHLSPLHTLRQHWQHHCHCLLSDSQGEMEQEQEDLRAQKEESEEGRGK